jgi:hypothetical protein
MLRMNEAPKIEVAIIPSSETPGGVGEPGTSGLKPAIANAVFAATGVRLASYRSMLQLFGHDVGSIHDRWMSAGEVSRWQRPLRVRLGRWLSARARQLRAA